MDLVHAGPEGPAGQADGLGGVDLQSRQGGAFIDRTGGVAGDVAEDLAGFLHADGEPGVLHLRANAAGIAKQAVSLPQAAIGGRCFPGLFEWLLRAHLRRARQIVGRSLR